MSKRAGFYGLKVFDKKSTCSGVNMYANNERPLDLAELHKKNNIFKI